LAPKITVFFFSPAGFGSGGDRLAYAAGRNVIEAWSGFSAGSWGEREYLAAL
jgi:hypothetical protein